METKYTDKPCLGPMILNMPSPICPCVQYLVVPLSYYNIQCNYLVTSPANYNIQYLVYVSVCLNVSVIEHKEYQTIK